MNSKESVLQCILDQGILPLFFHESASVSLEVTKTLYRAGIRVVEYTNRGKTALENLQYLKKNLSNDFPDLHLGIGTIKSAQEARAFIDAGADFIVAPIVNPEVAAIAEETGLLWIPGCMTPTEIFTAQQHQAALIKIFPANIVSAEFISSIKELFPGQLFIPTGGVDVTYENISNWFKAGVCAVGMGSKLISKSLLEKRAFEELYNKTLEVLQIIKAVKKVDRL